MVTTWLRGTQPQIPKLKFLVANLNIPTGQKKVMLCGKELSEKFMKITLISIEQSKRKRLESSTLK